MSDELIIDLTEYKDRVGNRVEPGRYDVMVDDAEKDTAKSGNSMINVWFRILTGDFKDDIIVDRLVLTPQSLFRVVGFMQAIGLPTPKKRMKVQVHSFVGKTLSIDVEDGDPYLGRVKSEVRGYIRNERSSPIVSSDIYDLEDIETKMGMSSSYPGQTDNPNQEPVTDEEDIENLLANDLADDEDSTVGDVWNFESDPEPEPEPTPVPAPAPKSRAKVKAKAIPPSTDDDSAVDLDVVDLQ